MPTSGSPYPWGPASSFAGNQLRNPSRPAKPLVSFQTYRQLSGWNPPPLMIRAIRAHCHFRTLALQQVHASAIAGAKLETSEGSLSRYGYHASALQRWENLASRSHSNSMIS